MKIRETRINSDLKYENFLNLIIEDKIENISFNKAYDIAKSLNLDLVEISKKDGLPLCKLIDYGKFLFEKKRKDKINKSNKQICKEIYLSANISEHDMNTKVKNTETFINKNYRVKVTLTLKGRENGNKDYNGKTILAFIVKCESFAVSETLPKVEGNKFIVYLKKIK